MILLVKNSHFKILYEKNEKGIKDFLIEKFSFKNEKLMRTFEVKKGLKSPYETFYIDEYDLLPTGFLPFTKAFLKKENIDFEVKDLRKFPKHDENFLTSDIKFKSKIDKKTIYRPRDYQLEALKEVIKKKGGCICIATGLGKGFIHALICKAYPKARILNIFDRIDLIDQTYEAFTKKYGFSEKEVGIIQGTRIEDDKRIILLSLMSYESAMGIFPNIDIIIGDEAHSTMRNDTAEKIIFSCQKASIKIGISATIDKIANPYEQAKLYSITGPIIYRKEIIEGIDEKSLSPGEVTFHSYTSEAKEIVGTYQDIYETKKLGFKKIDNLSYRKKTIFKNKKEIKKIKNPEQINKIQQLQMLKNNDLLVDYLNEILQKDFESNLINEGWEPFNKKGVRYIKKFIGFGDESISYIENDVRNQLIKKIALEESSLNRRTLVLFSRIDHGIKLKELIPNALLISGINSKEERNEAETFIKGNKNAIVIVSTIWQTGKDIPELESFINASGGKSAISLIQRIGRLTRKSDGSNKNKFYFHDFIDNHINPIARKQTSERIKIVQELKLPIVYKEH